MEIVLLSCGDVPEVWRSDPYVVRCHMIYDLVAIERSEWFSSEQIEEVRQAVATLNVRSVVIVFAPQIRDELLRIRPDLSPAQVTVLPLGSNCASPVDDPKRRAAVRADFGIPADCAYLLCELNGLMRDELELLLRAIDSLEERSRNAPCLVLTGTPGFDLGAALGSTHLLRPPVLLTEPIAHDEMAVLYSDALCVLHVSRRQRLGLSAVEAMSCGTPTVVYSNSLLSSLLGAASIAVGEVGAEGLAQAIGDLASRPQEQEALRQRCLERARDLNWSRSASSLMEVLLDADRRFQARPVSMLWQYPEEAPVDPDAPASFLGFCNGASSPAFGLPARGDAAGWPRWGDTLPPAASGTRLEGGLRSRGEFKSGTPEAPLVSYVTVVRNNVATLGRAIESVQRQTYSNFEHIVVDGASIDGTVDLILRYADRLDYFVSEPDLGLYDAINKAVPLARGQLICILNSDDWLEPHAAEIAVRRMLDRAQEAALLATGALIYSLEGRVEVEWPPVFVHPGSYFACANVCHNGVYATRAAYERSGPYDKSFRIAADFKWVMACVDAGVEFVYTREVTVNYSLGGTSGDARGHSRECQRVVQERFPFLSRQEVLGLYDSYFLFGHQPHDDDEPRHETLTALLRRLFVEHVDHRDFLTALTWAAMTKLEHPSDIKISPIASAAPTTPAIPSIRRSAKDLVKGLLHRYPRLYRAALVGYARIRK